MRFILFIFLLIACISNTFASSVYAQENRLTPTPEEMRKEKTLKGVLRGFIWGLPPTVILENEKGTFMAEQNGALFYLDYIRGLKSTIAYDFLQDKLYRAQIFIEQKYVDPQDRLEDLLVIQQDLTKRYGEPVSQEFRWEKETEKEWPQAWGWAVLRGELFITMIWQDAETQVTAYLGAKERLKPLFTVTYIDRIANDLLKKKGG